MCPSADRQPFGRAHRISSRPFALYPRRYHFEFLGSEPARRLHRPPLHYLRQRFTAPNCSSLSF